MEQKVNKKKINKSAIGCAILYTALVAGAGAVLADNAFDHTNGTCLIASLCSHPIDLQDGNQITLGMIHQIKQMNKEYEETGADVTVYYDFNYQDQIITEEKLLATQTISEDGTISYSAPEGYDIAVIDGVYYAIKTVTSVSSETCEAIVVESKNPNVGKIKVLKIGE